MAQDSILIVAAEASSEAYALQVMREFKARGQDIHFFGIGGKRMQAEGFEIIESADNVAVVGLAEVLSHGKEILRAFKNMVAAAEKYKPKAVLLLDFPDFNLQLAKRLKQRNFPIVYYVSPQVWAWRKGRVHTIKALVQKMLVVFPFETKFYEEHQVPVKFVGHPILDELSALKMTDEERKKERARYGVTAENHFVGLLPGSRRGELKYNLQTQIKAAEIIAAKHKQTRFFLLVAPNLDADFVKQQLPQTSLNLVFIKDDPVKIMKLADSLIVTSGTATLFAGLSAAPMVIMYRVSGITYRIGRMLVRNVKFFGLPNLILNEGVVPELLQYEATPERIAQEISRYIDEPLHAKNIRAKLSQIVSRLGSEGAAKKVVDELSEILMRKGT